jgi:phosphohistidine phosphatase
MNLFILRHAIALNAGEDGLPKDLPDADRPLSKEGKEKLLRSCAALREMKLNFDAVLSSPLLRAKQTAQIVAKELKLKSKPVQTAQLAPDGSPKLLIEQLLETGVTAKNILLVGHEPYLSQFISLLISGSTTAAIELKKGGLAKLEVRHLGYARCATLAWLLTPKQLRQMPSS